jgi:hypothetical protein
MPVHPVKVQAQKDIETFKRLLAKLKAGRRGGVMKAFGLMNPRSTST